jgi:hypothetical protein
LWGRLAEDEAEALATLLETLAEAEAETAEADAEAEMAEPDEITAEAEAAADADLARVELAFLDLWWCLGLTARLLFFFQLGAGCLGCLSAGCFGCFGWCFGCLWAEGLAAPAEETPEAEMTAAEIEPEAAADVTAEAEAEETAEPETAAVAEATADDAFLRWKRARLTCLGLGAGTLGCLGGGCFGCLCLGWALFEALAALADFATVAEAETAAELTADAEAETAAETEAVAEADAPVAREAEAEADLECLCLWCFWGSGLYGGGAGAARAPMVFRTTTAEMRLTALTIFA